MNKPTNPDLTDRTQEAWALAIHQAIENDPDSWMERVFGHGFSEGDEESSPWSGYIDGKAYDLAGSLRAAGWTPPSGIVEEWRDKLGA